VNADPSIELEIQNLEERLLDPEVRRSGEEIAALLADEFIEFGSSGRVFDKRQIIESLKSETPVRRTLVDFKTLLLAPGVVLATYRVIRHEGLDAESTYSLRSSVWKLIDDRWQMVFHQGTLSKKSN